jgi:hypothetical protein
MKSIDEIINEMKQHAADRFNEGHTINESIKFLTEMKTLGPVISPTSETLGLAEYPGYPLDSEDILPKFKCIEDKTQKIWSKKDIEKIITSIDKKAAKKTLKGLYNRLNNMVNAKKLVRLKFSGNSRYTFYTSHQDWIQVNDEGGVTKYRIDPKYIDETKIVRLTEEAASQDNIEWDGIAK